MEHFPDLCAGASLVGDDFRQDVTAVEAAGIQAVWCNARYHEWKAGAEHRTMRATTELPQDP
jgi:FMN phosphatase YigB (HAD superfamily)